MLRILCLVTAGTALDAAFASTAYGSVWLEARSGGGGTRAPECGNDRTARSGEPAGYQNGDAEVAVGEGRPPSLLAGEIEVEAPHTPLGSVHSTLQPSTPEGVANPNDVRRSLEDREGEFRSTDPPGID